MKNNRRIFHIITNLMPLFLITAVCPATPATSDKPSLLIIVIDTQRMDAAGCYGNDRPTTPWLDRISQKGTLAVDAVSTCCWTTPAVASLFTGLHPSAMRARQPSDKPPSDKSWFFRWRFSEEALTLAEHLSAHGYHTAGFVGNSILTANRGFGQGFDHYEVVPDPSPAIKVNRSVVRYIQKNLNTTPFFLYVHYYDPHGPYMAPHPWRNVLDRASQAAGETEITKSRLKDRIYLYLKDLKYLDQYRDRYLAEVRYADHCLGEVICALEQKGLTKNMNVAVTSDHGESFLEHGRMGHRNYLYREEIDIPMVLTGPSVPEGHLLPGPAQIIDIFPTICGLSSIPVPDGPVGIRLFDPAGNSLPNRQLVFETNTRRIQRAVREGHWKLLMDEHDRSRLLNLETDPQELENVISQNPEKTLSLKRILDEWAGRQLNKQLPTLSIEMETMDPELVKSLQALGYVDD
ncbi:sulfatase [bacterium]|nr:sulfatase [candidate division CSSED10-310 bacterium]